MKEYNARKRKDRKQQNLVFLQGFLGVQVDSQGVQGDSQGVLEDSLVLLLEDSLVLLLEVSLVQVL